MSIEKGSSKYGARDNAEQQLLIPSTPEEMERAKSADLITLPKDVKGTNCSNCKFVKLPEKFCTHPKVDMPVNERMCCAFWDAIGVIRPWE